MEEDYGVVRFKGKEYILKNMTNEEIEKIMKEIKKEKEALESFLEILISI